MRRSTVTLAAILVAGAAMRFTGIGSGIPFALGIDEPQIMTRAVGMMRSGDFNPHFFDYPTLYIYVQLATASLRFMAGAAAGEWQSLAAVTPADFYVWGRAVTAAFGTATVLLVYMAGLRWGTRTALLSAALMAVMPIHVRESHYVLTDVPLTFFVALTLVLTLRAHEAPRLARFALAGAAAGLAAGTKYPGALALALPLAAIWMTPSAQPSRLAAALACAGASGAAFLAVAPYTVLDLPGFLNGFARLANAYTGARADEPGWSIYLKHLRNAVRWPAFLLMLAGLGLALVRATRGPGRVRWTLAALFPLLFLWFISRQSLIYGRYLLPLVPFTCLLAGAAVVSGVSLLRRFSIPRALRTAAIVALTVAVLLPSSVTSYQFNRRLVQRGTAALAYEWILQNIPQDAHLVSEPGAPDLTQTKYRARVVTGGLRQHPFEEYAASADYLIASSDAYGRFLDAPHLHPTGYAQYMQIFEQSREVARFSPSAAHPGPEVRILAVRRSGTEGPAADHPRPGR
jgi:4-amino-4-deoxy-L-arabinose transferase-like glycosyltransferase